MQDARRTPAGVEPLDRRAMLSAATLTAAPRAAAALTLPARQVEQLDRGLVAVNRGGGQGYLSWRLLGLDPASVAFNVYRSANGAAATKLNATPIAATTDYSSTGNDLTKTNVYTVRPVVNGVEGPAGGTFTLAAAAVRNSAGHTMAAARSSTFHRLFGDSDGDKDVDNLDSLRFRTRLNSGVTY